MTGTKLYPHQEKILETLRKRPRAIFQIPNRLGMSFLYNKTPMRLCMPWRIHKKKRWMSEQYHMRIQKKWNKRFGSPPAKIEWLGLPYNPDNTKQAHGRIFRQGGGPIEQPAKGT